MAQLSRVKKYENLRKEIENEKKVSGIKSDLLDTNRILNTTEETYTPVHKKSFDSTTTAHDSAFKNDYLDSFIQEVRQYNIQKGIRENEDTKLDILQQLSSKNREKRANYIQQIEDTVVEPIVESNESLTNTDVNEQTLEISRQVFELINEDSKNVEVEELNKVEEVSSAKEVKPMTSLEEKIAALEKEVKENNLEEKEVLSETARIAKPILEQEEVSKITKQELMEHTLELKAKVDSYKEELTEMNNDINSNNKLLNIIIVILVLALFSVIGVVIYWLVSGGIL